MPKTYTYKGETIERCERADRDSTHRGRWIIRRVDMERRLIWADELCIHRNTLADCREAIDELKWHLPEDAADASNGWGVWRSMAEDAVVEMLK